MENSKSRTLINLIGVPLLLLIIYLGGFYFSTLIFFAIFICTKELDQLCEKSDISIQVLWLYLFYTLLYITHFIEVEDIGGLLYIDLLGIAILLISISELFRTTSTPIKNISSTIFTLIWIGVFLNSVVLIRNNYGMEITYFMFLSIWACDTFAYIFGKKFGKNKIFPRISPNKTWLGSIAGFISTFIFIIIIFTIGVKGINKIDFTFVNVFIIAIIFGIVSQAGDAIESMIKREADVKDSGTILQGHGGMLDRLDSMILVSPCFYIFLKIVIN